MALLINAPRPTLRERLAAIAADPLDGLDLSRRPVEERHDPLACPTCSAARAILGMSPRH